MILADYIAKFLGDLRVRHIFMLSGTGSVRLDDAFARNPNIEYVCARHEATAVVMASAAAKVSGNIGVAVVTTGPGGANAIAGAVEAWVDSVPLMIISGQAKSNDIVDDRSFGVQGFNIIDSVQQFTKYAVKINNPQMIKYELEKSIHAAFSGRPGPVWVDIPEDFQNVDLNLDQLKSFHVTAKEQAMDMSCLEQFARLYNASKKPCIIFGQGVNFSNTTAKLISISSALGIPTISSRMANDLLSSFENYFGMGGIRGDKIATKIMHESDLFICLGTSNPITLLDRSLTKSSKIISVNIDDVAHFKGDVNIDLSIKMDLSCFFESLDTKKLKFDNKNWLAFCKNMASKYAISEMVSKENPINSYYFAHCLSELTNEKHVFVNDAGSSNYICSQGLRFNSGQKEVTSGAFYTMGLALPLAIGAAVSLIDKQIIVITGDGSIELNIQELQTINLLKLNVKVFVINNGGYASIRDSQDAMCGGRYTDSEQILNFEKIADAFGLGFSIIRDVSEIKEVVERELQSTQPSIIEVVCDSKQHMFQPVIELANEEEYCDIG